MDSSVKLTPSSHKHQEEAGQEDLSSHQKPCLNLQEEDAGLAAVYLGPVLGADPHLGGDDGGGAAVAQVAQANQKWREFIQCKKGLK